MKSKLVFVFFVFILCGCRALPLGHRAPAQASEVSQSRSCSETTLATASSVSNEIEYFQALLARGSGAPMADFLHLWFPNRAIEPQGAYFFNCRDSHGHLKYQGNFIQAGCEPDTLYSWQWEERAQSIFDTFKTGLEWSGDANPFANRSGGGFPGISATISPVSTYSYGPVVVRYKVKKDIKFESDWMPRGTNIGYPSRLELQDFLIARQSSIESISMGTPEIYDEIVKDIRQISSDQPSIDFSGKSRNFVGMERVYQAGIAERGPQDEATLKLRLLNLIKTILENRGRINYALGECQNRRLHYSTTKPTYFNAMSPE